MPFNGFLCIIFYLKNWRIMKNTLLALSLLGLFILQGCGTNNINADYKFGQGDTGFIYGSVFVKDGFDTDITLYKKGKSKPFRTFSAVDGFRNRDFNEKGSMGSLFAVTVPAGEYEIKKFRVSHKITKTNFHDVFPTSKQTLSFKVGKSTPIYIGSYYGSGYSTGKLEIYNKMNRDKRYLLKKYPKLGITKSINQTPTLKTWK